MAQTSPTLGAVPRRHWLLRTKLHIPPLRPNFVARPRLTAQFEEGPRTGCKLTFVSAPVGFGTAVLLFGSDAAAGGTRRNEEAEP